MASTGISPGIFVSFESRAQSGHDFSHLISTERIYKALVWLKQNNPLYANIELPEYHASEEGINECEFVDIDECAAVDVDDHLPFQANKEINEGL